jgi:hypothetical protein
VNIEIKESFGLDFPDSVGMWERHGKPAEVFEQPSSFFARFPKGNMWELSRRPESIRGGWVKVGKHPEEAVTRLKQEIGRIDRAVRGITTLPAADEPGPDSPSPVYEVDGICHIRACVDLKVPETGVDWLDDLITKSRLDDFKKAALIGVVSACNPSMYHKDITGWAREIALLAAAPAGVAGD